MAKQKSNGASRERNVLVLQGGGALGAYQAGAYEALSKAGIEPDWVAGISIGAVNAAIIAGNRPEDRAPRLRQFWDLVSSRLTLPPLATDENSRKLFNETSAAIVASTGAPGFFTPRYPPAVFNLPGSIDAISIYDTHPLKETLLEVVDFDALNSGAIRYSVGAVQVDTGNLKYFDTQHDTITPEHIMASGALPPGFPPIEIEGKLYWDGGIVSNTPLQYVFDGGFPRNDTCVFQIDLFSARGQIPQTLFDVQAREKEIRYSSRTRLNTDNFRLLQSLRHAVRRLDGVLPEDVKRSFDWKLVSNFSSNAAVTIVHLIHRRAVYSTQSNDYEFSRYTINEHWLAGQEDVESTLESDEWKHRAPTKDDVLVLDCTKDLQPPPMEKSR